MTDFLDESRNAVAILSALYAGDPKRANVAALLVRDPAKLLVAYQALLIQALRIIDELAIAAGIPDASAMQLLGRLRDQMAMAEGIEI
ncbi:MAG TPA: hypothetical protein VG253_21335 [Streptosporangiaceae bacterium]|jgi:hypothetical protein|nr:hypothetical protein [Streptosporangiaceae bacterium]